jgi:hypothetical protein
MNSVSAAFFWASFCYHFGVVPMPTEPLHLSLVSAALFPGALMELGFSSQQIHSLVAADSRRRKASRYTYLDLVQRLLPGALLAAYPLNPITYELAKDVIARHLRTPPFKDDKAH